MTTRNRIKTVLTLAVVAILALAVTQVQAAEIEVPNGDFETIVKPGTTIAATIADGEYFSIGNKTMHAGAIAYYADGTSGSGIELPGWVVAAGSNNNADCMQAGGWGGPDGSGDIAFLCFGTWGGPTYIESAAPLSAPAGSGIGNYTLSADVYFTARPLILKLLVDGVEQTPNTASSPPAPNPAGQWVEFTRTYSSVPAGDVTILVGTRNEEGEGWTGTGTRASVDNITLDFVSVDPDAPTVDAGIDMISWSGQAVTMDPNVVNNDTTIPQRDLTYLWTAEPNGIGDPNLDVAITGANTENASVTITKTAPTGDVTVIMMTLAVTLEGKDPVTDSMTIDVYDDACVAALDLGLTTIDTTDLDGNCITAFPDFAVMAVTWLDDYALTEAVAK
jgi:hypothetical protein